MKFFKKRCKARLKRGEDPKFHGRCELPWGHYSQAWEEHHMIRGDGVNVRWIDHERGRMIRYEES